MQRDSAPCAISSACPGTRSQGQRRVDTSMPSHVASSSCLGQQLRC